MMLKLEEPGLSEQEREDLIDLKFGVVITLQQYSMMRDADQRSYNHGIADMMLKRWSRGLAIAYIHKAVQNGRAEWFSCLIDGTCPPGAPRKPKYTIKLPGPPVLSNGKGENQNHAIVFAHGRYLQALDANHEGYLEEAFKVCSLLNEFNSPHYDEPPWAVASRENIFSGMVRSLQCLQRKRQYSGPL
jgi:1,3-beta-glucan synthase